MKNKSVQNSSTVYTAKYYCIYDNAKSLPQLKIQNRGLGLMNYS